MEAEGYEVQAFVLPACAVNAPHSRDRVWFVAHRIASHPHNNGSHIPENRQGMGEGNDGNEKGKNKAGKLARRSGKNAKLAADTTDTGVESLQRPRENGIHGLESTANARSSKPQGRHEAQEGQQHARGRNPRRKFAPFGSGRIVANTTGEGRKERKQSRLGTNYPKDGAGLHDRPERFGSNGNARNANIRRRYKGTFGKVFGKEQSPIAPRSRKLDGWERFPTQSPVRSRNDGLSTRLAGITVSRHRRESIKAYGNAIVPQVAVQIFKAIIEAERRMRE